MASRYEPLTPAQAEARMRQCAARLLEAIDEHGVAAEEEAEAMADYQERLQLRLVQLFDEHAGDRAWPVGRVEATAKAEVSEFLRVQLAATAKRRSLGEEMHSLRQVLSSLQTNARVMGQVA